MKSRMAEVQIVTDSLEKGLSLWVLNNGVPSVSETHIPFEELDITLPLICEANQKCYTSPSKWQVAGGSEALLLHALFVTNGIATVSITVPNTATFGTPTISFSYDLSNSLVSKSCTYSSSDNASKVTCETLKSLDNRWNVIRASGRTPPPQS